MLKLRRELLGAGVLLAARRMRKLLAAGVVGVLLATGSARTLLAARVTGVLLAAKSMRKLLAAGVVGVLLVTVVAACGDSSPSREDVLSDLADEVIIPAYEDFLQASTRLADAVDGLCAIVSDTSSAGTATGGETSASDASTADASATAEGALNAAHDALAATRDSWSFSEAMWVGPVMDRRSRALIDWEIDAEQIDARIADTSFALTAENLATRVGADERGLGAAEYILGSPSASEATLLKLANPRYCEYLQATTQVAAGEAQALQSDWTASFEGSSPYRSTFSDPDGNGLDDIVNDIINLLRKTSDMELRRALDGDIDTIQEGPFGRGVDDIAHHLAGIRAVLIGGVKVGSGEGAGGGGIEDEINGLSELLGGDITDRLTARLDAADAAVAALDTPLQASISENPAEVEAAYDALKALQVTIATEVVSKLGVAIGFSDTDGDSAG